MGEAIEKKLVEIYESLTDEQKEKLEDCNSLEELFEFVDKAGIELPQEVRDYLIEAANKDASELSLDDLESVAGGTPGTHMYRTFRDLYRMVTGRRFNQEEVNRVRAEAQQGEQAN